MPTDTRRLPVPEESNNPQIYASKSKELPKLLNDKGKRQDGRKVNQMRPIFLKCGVVSQARGSAYVELNKTKVICAVYGPREVTKREEFSMTGQLNCEFKYATFSCPNRRQHQQDMQENHLSVVLQQALEPAVCMDKFPKARMDVFITVIEDDGSSLAASISCASAALANGGVEMYDVVVGCSVRNSGDLCLLDPSRQEEFTPGLEESPINNAGITVGYMPSIHQVSALEQTGQLDLPVAQEGIKLCISTCQRAYPIIQQSLIRAVKDRLKDAT